MINQKMFKFLIFGDFFLITIKCVSGIKFQNLNFKKFHCLKSSRHFFLEWGYLFNHVFVQYKKKNSQPPTHLPHHHPHPHPIKTQKNKRFTCLDGHLRTIARRWTCQRVQLHIKLHFGVQLLYREYPDCYSPFYYFMLNIHLLKEEGEEI